MAVEKIEMDGEEYDLNDLSDSAKAQVLNLQFVEAQLIQLQNELAVSDTARIGYARALKSELKKLGKSQYMVQKIKIDDVEYIYEDLTDTARSLLKSIDFIVAKVTNLENMQAIMQRAKNSYIETLKKEMLADKAGFLIQEDEQEK